MSVCANCGSQQPDGAAFCDECGAELATVAPAPVPPAVPPMQPTPTAIAATCPACNAQVMPGETFCNNCGADLSSAVPVPAPQPPAYAPSPPGAAPTMAGALTCPNCGAQLEPGSQFCDMCGASVNVGSPSTPPPGPQPAYTPPQPGPRPGYTPPQPGYQPAYTPPSGPQPGYPGIQGRLVVQGTNATLPFPPGKSEITVGREDPVSNVFPEVDLTDHGGDEGGVSRLHARIFVQGTQIFVEDLNSTNYTYVNQQRLSPGQPHPINSGDEVWFGRVKLHFYT